MGDLTSGTLGFKSAEGIGFQSFFSTNPTRNKAGWWFGTFFTFPYIGNNIIPTDFHIFQSGRSTTNQFLCLDRLQAGWFPQSEEGISKIITI